MEGGATACYLYCVCPARHLLGVPDCGVDQAPVFLIEGEDLIAVASEVRLEEFCGEDAEQRLKQLSWVAPRVCQHEAVIDGVLRQAPVLPTRFATLFRSRRTLEEFLAQQHGRIAAFFEWLGQRREWAVKGVLDETNARTGETGSEGPARSPGAQYLHRKRGESLGSAERSFRLREYCRSAAMELQKAAEGFRERKALDHLLPESGLRVIFNWAFLLSPEGETGFNECVDRLHSQHARDGLDFRVSGPWPPYSFAPALQETST